MEKVVTPRSVSPPPLTLQPPPAYSTAKKVSFTLSNVPPINTDSSGYVTSSPNSQFTDHTVLSHDQTASSFIETHTDSVFDDTAQSMEEEDEVIEDESPKHELPSILRRRSSIMDLIAAEAESLTVLVGGGIKFLDQPVTAFVRLEQVRVTMLVLHCVTELRHIICNHPLSLSRLLEPSPRRPD